MRRLSLRYAFKFSDVSDHRLSGLHSIVNAGEIGYFKEKCKCHLIVEFVGLQPTKYSVTVVDAENYDTLLPVGPVQLRHKAVAKEVSRANIKRFTNDDYVTMFPEGDALKVKNHRISSKLYQVIITVSYKHNVIVHNIAQSFRFTR